MASLEQQLTDLREQAANQYQIAKHTDGPAYEKQITRYQVLKRQADALEKRIKDAAKARKNDLAKIHIAKKDLALDETSYRALLTRVTKKTSSGDLTATDRARVLAEFKRLGWRPKRISPKRSGLRGKITALWIDMGKKGLLRDGSERALQRYCQRMTHKRTIDWLTQAEEIRLLESLKKWRKRMEETGA